MASTPYSVGTITVANGSTSVAGTDTFWIGSVDVNDMLFVPSQGLMARITADPTDNEVLAITAWAGTSLTDAAYEIIPAADSTTSSARLRDLLAQMSVIEANGRGLFYRFSDSVTDADPGSGFLRLNNATIGSATAAYLDNLDANGATVSAELDTWDASTSLNKGTLWLRAIADPSVFHSFKITGSVVDGTGYRKLTLVYVGGSSTFSADDEMMAFFVSNGDQGEGFVTDTEVADPSELTALEGEAEGYLVFVTDLETDFGAYSGRSGVVRLITGPDWEVVAVYTGTQGETGEQGDKGWSPQIVVVSDGVRRVHQLSGYVGGAGTAPTANVGEYLKGDGTFTATIADAADVRGPAGLNGAGTVASVEAGDGVSVDSSDPTAPEVSMVAFTGDSGAGGAIGGVPAPSSGDAAAGKVLGAGGGWITPSSVPKGYIYGLTLSNNVTDATNDIDISAGEAASSDASPTLLVLASALTKRLDAAWAVGSGNGGLDTGSIANGTYHIWLIRRSDTGVVEALFSASATSPTLPTNYDQKRRVGAILRESGAIVGFSQKGDNFLRSAASLDVNATNPGTSAVSRALSVPTGIAVISQANYVVSNSGTGVNVAFLVSALDQADAAPSNSSAPLAQILNVINSAGGASNSGTRVDVRTNTSAQVRTRLSLSDGSVSLKIATLGWVDSRGRFG